MMSVSPRLPPHTTDQLRDRPSTLKTCSVVSRPGLARSREHISSIVVARQNAFPDPVNSPAYHTQTLIVNHHRRFPENRILSICNSSHVCSSCVPHRRAPRFVRAASQVHAVSQITSPNVQPHTVLQRHSEPRVSASTAR